MKNDVVANLVAKVEARILFLRGHRVMLSTHLAELYGGRTQSPCAGGQAQRLPFSGRFHVPALP